MNLFLQAAAKEYGLDAKKDMWRLPALICWTIALNVMLKSTLKTLEKIRD